MSNPPRPDDTVPAPRPGTSGSNEGTQPPAQPERRFTAPSGFDAGKTQIIGAVHDPPTEIISIAGATTAFPGAGSFAGSGAVTDSFSQASGAAPQQIPGRAEPKKPRRRQIAWGWVIAVILVIAALVAIAVLGVVLLTHNETPKVTQEGLVVETIRNFDASIQKGDLATLRSITCGETANSYLKYDDAQWKDTHARISAAKRYPMIASVDQVIVQGNHAEANVTTFMAFDPSMTSSRSFDLELLDQKWKICQAPS